MDDDYTEAAKQNSKDSCTKCVKVLRDILSDLQKNNGKKGVDSHPMTLLKGIARGKEPKVETIEDGVRMSLPVETTEPTLLRRWSSLMRQNEREQDNNKMPHHTLATSVNNDNDDDNNRNNNISSNNTNNDDTLTQDLTIELKCRKCASSGPEAGARAFLMGPSPLSVIVCHNRIQSNVEEVEEILTHELVHLYDVQTLQLDLQQCENLAYSEVRAAKHAECRDAYLQKYCVKQKAICATNNLFPVEGRKCIQKVFHKAFEDNRPFQKDEKPEFNS